MDNLTINAKLPTAKVRTVNFANDLYKVTDAELTELERMYGEKVPDSIRKTRVDVSDNVRELHRYTDSELEPLVDSINEDRNNGGQGIKDAPVYVEDESGKLRPVQGHRRTIAGILAGLTTVRAMVYPPLTRQQKLLLLLDHGQRQGLNLVEIFYSIKKGYNGGLTQKQLAVELRPLLEQIRPLTEAQLKKIAEKPTDEAKKQALLDCYRGRIQGHIRVCNLPDEVEVQWINKLRGKQNWPSEEEVRELDSIFQDERSKDPMITKDRPGPKYQARWQKILDAVAAAEAEGVRPKSTGMKNRKDIDETKKRTPSVFVRCTLEWVTNDLPDDRFAPILAIMRKYEALLDDSEAAVIRAAFDSVKTTTEQEQAPKEEAAPVEAGAN